MHPYTLIRYEVVIGRRGDTEYVPGHSHTYEVWADSDVNAAFQAGASHVAEGHHAADMEIIGIRHEYDV